MIFHKITGFGLPRCHEISTFLDFSCEMIFSMWVSSDCWQIISKISSASVITKIKKELIIWENVSLPTKNIYSNIFILRRWQKIFASCSIFDVWKIVTNFSFLWFIMTSSGFNVDIVFLASWWKTNLPNLKTRLALY